MAAASYQQVRNATRDAAFKARIAVAVSRAQDATQKGATYPLASLNGNDIRWVHRHPEQEAERIFFWVLNTSPIINTLGGGTGDQVISPEGIINPSTFTDAQIQTAVDALVTNLIEGAINA